MDRRWLGFTALLCVAMIALSLLASGRARKSDVVVERDGFRTVHRRVFGLFSYERTVADPTLHVSDDLTHELKRLGISLAPATRSLLKNAYRQKITPLQTRYGFGGEVAAMPKSLVDALARQIAHPRRTTTSTMDQFSGTAADGKSQIDVVADRHGSSTYFDLGLTVLR